MSPDYTHNLRVAIVGGGIAGLLVAQGLQKNGYKATVYERDTHLNQRDREWTMSIHWSLPNLQQILPADILADMPLAYTDQHGAYDVAQPPVPFYNGLTGAIPHHVPAPNLRRLSRARFRDLCTRGLDIRWGKKLVDMTSCDPKDHGPVTLHFQDNNNNSGVEDSVVEADLVIGADGTSSKVRRLLLGEEAGAATASEWSMYNGVACYGDAAKALFVREAHPLCALAFTDHGLAFCGIQDVPDPDAPETWSFNVLRFVEGQTKSAAGDAVIQRLKDISRGICEPFHSAIRWIPSGSKFFATRLHYWVTAPWDNKGARFTLVGDAAHAMLPSRGQGMNHALEDVGRLVAQMERVKRGTPVAEALRVYEQEVVERGRDAVVRSLEDCRANTNVGESRKTRLATKGLGA